MISQKFSSRKSSEGVQFDVRKLVDPNIEYWVLYLVFGTIFDIQYHT